MTQARTGVSMFLLVGLLTIAAIVCTGCSKGVRFSVDLIDTERGVGETVITKDPDADSWSDTVAMIEVSGTIQDARTSGLMSTGPNPVDRFVQSLERARNDSKVKAVILRINSRGGTVTASELMHGELIRFREDTGKPVIVLMGDYAASGGYYLACAGDHIIAAPSTITGSIGVIMQTFDLSEGMSRIGIRADALTSGPNKAMASPLQPMQPEHRELLQNIINEFYTTFRGVVVASRPNLAEENVDRVTDGRVVTGTQAVELGLVDEIGTVHDAFRIAKECANLDRARLVKYHGAGSWTGSAYANAPTPAPNAGTQLNMMQVNLDTHGTWGSVGFFYMWDPSAWGG